MKYTDLLRSGWDSFKPGMEFWRWSRMLRIVVPHVPMASWRREWAWKPFSWTYVFAASTTSWNSSCTEGLPTLLALPCFCFWLCPFFFLLVTWSGKWQIPVIMSLFWSLCFVTQQCNPMPTRVCNVRTCARSLGQSSCDITGKIFQHLWREKKDNYQYFAQQWM